MPRTTRSFVALSGLVTVLMAIAAAVGLFVDGVYHDNRLVRAAWLGNDIVTLAVAVPLLGGATWRVRRGAPRPLLVCLGLLAYALYNYAFYAFGAAFNELFLIYVATLIGSTLGLIAGLTSAQLGHIVTAVRIRAADRWIGGLVLLIALLLGVFWSALAVQYAMTGDVPAMVIATGHPTNVTGVLDLWIVVSFGIWGGMSMLMGRPWGYVITTLWTVKGSVYMTALSAAAVAARGTGAAADLAQLALWIPIGVVCIVGSIVLVRTCPPESARGRS
jgi:hypothetical protein